MNKQKADLCTALIVGAAAARALLSALAAVVWVISKRRTNWADRGSAPTVQRALTSSAHSVAVVRACIVASGEVLCAESMLTTRGDS